MRKSIGWAFACVAFAAGFVFTSGGLLAQTLFPLAAPAGKDSNALQSFVLLDHAGGKKC